MLQREPISISYDHLVGNATNDSNELAFDDLTAALEDEWVSAYFQMCEHAAHILRFLDQGFIFLFDHCSATGGDAEDRLVAAYGRSQVQERRREAIRLRGFPSIEIPGKGTFDKGHVFAHSMGGGLDVNLSPQRADLNRGRSEEGKTYRRMEVYAAKYPGTFVFSRLIYADETWVPSSIEYGILLPEGKFWVEQFEN